MIHTKRQSQTGLSLVELMVAMTLTVIIAAAMISLFINAKQNYRINENMSRLQENARYAVSYIARDLRSAEYQPCPCPFPADPDNPEICAEYGMDVDPIAVQEGGEESVSGTDTVTISWLEWGPDPENPPSTLLEFCDLDRSDVVTSSETRTYSIQTGSRGSPALFRNGQELVEGIEDLQLLFGEDTDGDNVPNYYVDEASVTAMNQVVSIRVNLFASTLDPIALGGDDEITRAFTTTVTLRNRLP